MTEGGGGGSGRGYCLQRYVSAAPVFEIPVAMRAALVAAIAGWVDHRIAHVIGFRSELFCISHEHSHTWVYLRSTFLQLQGKQNCHDAQKPSLRR